MSRLRPTHTAFLVLLTGTLAATASAQDTQAIASFLRAYARSSVLSVRSEAFVTAALKVGVVRTPADIAVAKKLLTAQQLDQRRQLAASRAPRTGLGPLAIGPEQECNDHLGLADFAGIGTTSVTGDITDNDVDTFRIVVPNDSALRLLTSGNGPSPIGDTVLFLTDAEGQVVDFNDDVGFSLYSQVDARVPAGTYFARVEAGFGAAHNAGYRLSVTMTATTLPFLTSGQPVAARFTQLAERHTYALAVASDAAVTLTTAGSGGDLILSLHRPSMGKVHEVDDSAGGGSYPILRTRLPAGLWYVVVAPSPFAAPGAYTLTATVTPQAIPTAPCNGSVNGTTVGAESYDVYQLVHATPSRVRLSTAGGTLFDTVLELFDQSLGRVTFNDDANTSWSLIDTALPAGTYYVVVRPYPGNSGSYTLSAACGLGATFRPLANGRSSNAIANFGETAAFSYPVGTQGPVGFRIDQAASTLQSGILTVLDGTGHVVAYDDASVYWSGDALCGGDLPAGSYTVLARDLFASTGTVNLLVTPQLYLEPRGPAATLRSLDKAGRLHVLFASNAAGPGIPLAGAVTGNLLLNPGLVLYIAAGAMGSDGSYTWPLALGGFTGVVQAVSLDLTTLTGTMTNLER